MHKKSILTCFLFLCCVSFAQQNQDLGIVDIHNDEIKYFIKSDYIENRFGNTQAENDDKKAILSKNLYTVYSDKFIKQAFYFFKGSAWSYDDLKFIICNYLLIN